MQSLLQKIKTRFNNCTALQLECVGLGLISFIFMFVIRYKGVWHWDDLTYLKNIYLGLPSELLLGRPGFMYPLIVIWHLVKNLGTSFYFIEDLIRFTNMIFLSAAYVYIFRILIALKFSKRFSFLTIVILLSEFSFSVVGSRVGDSALMYFCIAASYYYFLTAHETNNLKKLLLSAFLFGYAFLVREPALFYFPFFVILIAYFKSQKKLFSLKYYIGAAGTAFVAAVVPIVLMFLNDRKRFVANLLHSSINGYQVSSSGLWENIVLLGEQQINFLLLPAVICGLILFFRRFGPKYTGGILICCLLPLAITFVVSNRDFLYEARLFFGLFFLNSFCIAFLIEAVATRVSDSRVKIVVLAALVGVATIISFTRFIPRYRSELAELSTSENYYEKIKPLLGRQVTLIIGRETYYVLYRGMADGVPPSIISPGWSWPTGSLVEVVNALLGRKMTVIYDPNSRDYMSAKRQKDLDEMTATFSLNETTNGFMQVNFKP